MLIRKARLDDERSVINLLKQFPPGVDNTDWEAGAMAFRKIIENPELGSILVAEVDGHVAGVTTLSFPFAIRCRGRYSCIEENIVDKNFRGKGLGGALLRAAIAEATEKGCDEIQVNFPSEQGYPLYIKYGFKDISKHLKAKLPMGERTES